MSKNSKTLIPEKQILKIIVTIRGEKVIIDSDLAALYGVETRRLNEQVRRNKDKFPDDFMFQLTKEEFDILKSQIATSSFGWGGRRKPPLVFTELLSVYNMLSRSDPGYLWIQEKLFYRFSLDGYLKLFYHMISGIKF